MRFIKKYTEFLNEKRHVSVKRKYGERPTIKVFDDAPVRERILNFVNKQKDGIISKHSLSEFLKMRNEFEGTTTSFSWVSKNSKYLKKFEKAGTIYYKLTPLAKRVIERTTINEIEEEETEEDKVEIEVKDGDVEIEIEDDEDDDDEDDDDEDDEDMFEARKTQVKRKYREYESISVGESAPIRDNILKYINERGNVISKTELSSYIQRWLNPRNKYNEDKNMKGKTTISWAKNNSKYLKEFERNGMIYYKLTPLAKRVITRNPLNEND